MARYEISSVGRLCLVLVARRACRRFRMRGERHQAVRWLGPSLLVPRSDHWSPLWTPEGSVRLRSRRSPGVPAVCCATLVLLSSRSVFGGGVDWGGSCSCRGGQRPESPWSRNPQAADLRAAAGVLERPGRSVQGRAHNARRHVVSRNPATRLDWPNSTLLHDDIPPPWRSSRRVPPRTADLTTRTGVLIATYERAGG